MRSCSMMNRSIVTTDVAVCWTTGLPLHDEGSVGQATRCARPRVRLVVIPGVSGPQRPPQVPEGKGTIGLKLMDVPEFVQEQFRPQRHPVGEPDGAPQGDPADRAESVAPSADPVRDA